MPLDSPAERRWRRRRTSTGGTIGIAPHCRDFCLIYKDSASAHSKDRCAGGLSLARLAGPGCRSHCLPDQLRCRIGVGILGRSLPSSQRLPAAATAATAGVPTAAGEMCTVSVLFFARSRELAGVSQASMTLEPGSTTATLQQQLLQQVRCGPAASRVPAKAAPPYCRFWLDTGALRTLLAACDRAETSPATAWPGGLLDSARCKASVNSASHPAPHPTAVPPTGGAARLLCPQPQPGVSGAGGGAAAQGGG